jgi:crotonobetainyl-CoA:carnitine CoA-transferase CaiB-like acyl-CoA transferase
MPDDLPADTVLGPLTGLTVVECSTWAFGPLCGVMLGDLGADVIKVENPNQPDAARTLLMVASADMEMPDGRSALFDIVNRNKRSVAIDLKSDRGRDLLKELIAGSDIFLQNFRPGVFDRMGLGYDDLAREQPRLIYARTSGYGLRGAEAERPALDPVGQARAGMFYASGEPGDPPNWISFAFADIMGASMLAYGVVAAVVARERHGVGQLVEASHLQASMWLEYWGIGAALYKGMTDWPRFDRTTAANPLFNHYQAADGEWLTIGVLDSTRHWANFCQALGLDALVHDSRFASATTRQEHAAELVALLDIRFMEEPRAVWEERLAAHPDLIFDRVQRIGDLPTDPAVIANGYIIDVEHPRYGSVPMIHHPVNLSATPATVRRTAPDLGQHTAEVLKERLGKTDEEIADLVVAGAIA